MVGLSNVDNTSDTSKQISTLTLTALNAKLNIPSANTFIYEQNYTTYTALTLLHAYSMQFGITGGIFSFPPSSSSIVMSMDASTGVNINTLRNITNNLVVNALSQFVGTKTCNDITSSGNLSIGNFGTAARLTFKNAGSTYNYISADASNNLNINCNNANILNCNGTTLNLPTDITSSTANTTKTLTLESTNLVGTASIS